MTTIPKHSLQIACRHCNEMSWYEDIRDDYNDDEPDLEYGTCSFCEHERHFFCDNCSNELGEYDTIFIFENISCETQTFCEECGNDLQEEMKADGWFRDDDEDWQEIQLKVWKAEKALQEEETPA